MSARERHVIVIILAFLMMGCIFTYGSGYAERESRPVVKIPSANRDKFSEVFILLDATGTMKDFEVADAKEIVKRRIIDSLGVNDKVSCYSVSGLIDGGESIVFGKAHEEQPPQLDDEDAREILKLYATGDTSARSKGCGEDECKKKIEGLQPMRQATEAVRAQWSKKVDEMPRPRVDGSDYIAALEAIKRQLGNSKGGHSSRPDDVRETWLFIVGDLINESSRERPNYKDNAAFKNVKHVVLIYPFNSGRDLQPVEKFWADYFGDIKTEKYTFAEAQREAHLIKPNPTSNLEVSRPPSYSDLIRPYLVADAVVLGFALLYFLACAVSQKLSSRQYTITANVQANDKQRPDRRPSW
jgi:hypothetical protein